MGEGLRPRIKGLGQENLQIDDSSVQFVRRQNIIGTGIKAQRLDSKIQNPAYRIGFDFNAKHRLQNLLARDTGASLEESADSHS